MSTMRAFGPAAAAAFLLAPASAAANDELLRGLIGVGSAIIMNQAQQQQQQRRLDERRPVIDARRAPSSRSSTRDGSDEIRMQRAEIQRRLNALGYDAGQPDGIYGPRTRRAIAKFQASLGRRADGILSREEVAALYAATGDTSGATAFDDGGSAGFPSLGSAPGETVSGEAGGFPALGGPPAAGDDTAASGFPKLGDAEQGTSADAAGDFPTLGAPAEQPAGGAFPALGETPQADGGQGNGMPKLATPAGSGEAAGFPTLTNAPPKPAELALPAVAPAPEQQAVSFPKTAQPPAPEETAMPALVAPKPEAKQEAMPKLGADSSASSGPATEATLAGEIARTVFGEPDAQPVIAGVALGQSGEEAMAALKKNGFSSCEEQARSAMCNRTTETLKDTVLLWISDEGVWAVRRTIEFASPAPAGFVMEQFRATYPQLLADPQRSVTSSTLCHASELPDMGLAALLGRMDKVLNAGDEKLPGDIFGYAQTCPLLYMIGFEGADTITAARITFIDATPFIRRGMREQSEREVRDKINREKLSEDLKL